MTTKYRTPNRFRRNIKHQLALEKICDKINTLCQKRKKKKAKTTNKQ